MLRILVVEDEPTIAIALQDDLEDEGYQVRLAENATAARAIRAEGRPDMVLLDIWISLRNCRYQGRPVDGLEVAQLVRQVPEGKSLPILLATAHAMEGDRERLLTASGANAYLEKPIYDPNILINKIKALVGQ